MRGASSSHQHVHLREPARSILTDIAHELAVPLRHYAPSVRYCGDFYGQTGEGLPLPESISVGRLLEILAALPPGVTELACHPGLDEDELNSTYRSERAEEATVLCDPRVRATIIAGGIELWSFGDLPLRGPLC
jgi:chitin disaccharide deacetylase